MILSVHVCVIFAFVPHKDTEEGMLRELMQSRVLIRLFTSMCSNLPASICSEIVHLYVCLTKKMSGKKEETEYVYTAVSVCLHSAVVYFSLSFGLTSLTKVAVELKACLLSKLFV